MSTSQSTPCPRAVRAPLGAHAPWQPLLRASCVAFRAQPKRRDAPAHRRPRPRPLHTRKSRAFNGRSNMARPHLGRRAPAMSAPTPPTTKARAELYESALSELRAKNDVYPCFLHPRGADAVSAPHAGDGTFRYPGLCRNLTPAEAEEKAAHAAQACVFAHRINPLHLKIYTAARKI